MRSLLLLLVLLASLVPSASSAATLDRAVANGWWYSQTGVPGEAGFMLVDDDKARFWSEFRRLGGVDALGYPVSHRFELDGFTVQATQRVILQWRPESGQAFFVNVFDKLHDLGQDGFLQSVRQTPQPRAFADGGKKWEEVVQLHLAVLDAHPALKAAYLAAPGDPIQSNGLPVSDVTDVGNHLSVRAQRVVLQQWKQDVPWAKAGQVTVALGGDIAKEVGLVPASATKPAVAPPDDLASALPVATATPRPGATPTAAPPGQTAPPPPGQDANVPTAPIGSAPASFVIGAADLSGSRVVDEGPVDAALLAQGRKDAPGYAARQRQAGFVRGYRRIIARDGAKPNEGVVVAGEVDLFRDPASARAYFGDDVEASWASPDPAARLDPAGAVAVGEEGIALRVVSGDVASRGYLIVWRRGNALAYLFALSQMVPPALDDTVALAKAMDGRIR